MIREIKFRVWDKTADNPQGRGLKGVMMCWEYASDSDYFKDALKGKYPLIQFTGLLDKSGNEIYEGDLLNIPFNESIREGVHEVFYYKDGFVTSSILFKNKETANKNSLTWMINRGAEVIGNIYENPELLSSPKV